MFQESLFTTNELEPLASRMRPESLEDIAGQQHLLGEGKILRRMIASDRLPSMIFWGPPGVGKTTLARVIASPVSYTHLDVYKRQAYERGGRT